MSAYWWVGLGGFLGSVARYALAVGFGAASPGRFPWATFTTNCIGCLLIGLLAGVFARTSVPEPVRLFLITGILGGFTTFSTFGLETVSLLRRGDLVPAVLYAVGTLLIGLAAVWLGLRLAGAAES